MNYFDSLVKFLNFDCPCGVLMEVPFLYQDDKLFCSCSCSTSKLQRPYLEPYPHCIDLGPSSVYPFFLSYRL